MSDFDEIIDFFTQIIGEAIEKVPDVGEIGDNLQDTIQSVWDKFSSSEFEIDDEHKEILIGKLAEAMNLSPEVVSEQLEAISNVSSSSFDDQTAEKVTDVVMENDQKWDGSFTSAGCWDECKVSVGDPGKRMVCGYYA